MLDYIFCFFLIWVLSFICHEFMHVFEHLQQGGHSYEIELYQWHGLPSMRVYLSGVVVDPRRVELAGGLYTSMLHLVILLAYLLIYGFYQSAFIYSLICIGLVQFFYGYFEMKYISVAHPDDYMVCHYLLYLVVIVVFSIVWVGI